MITKSFFDLTKKEKERTFEIEDTVDRLNRSVSCKLFLFSFLIIGAKVYWSSPIECYTPIAPSVKDFDKFAKEFGWIYSKYSKMPTRHIRQDQQSSESSQNQFILSYYMWTPFYLSLAAILLYLPHVILSYISKRAVDLDLQNSIMKARSVTRKTGPVTSESVSEIAENMNRMLNSPKTQVTGWLSRLKYRISRICPLAFPSKRNGTVLTCSYLFVTVMYLILSVVIVIGMARFVGYTDIREYFGSLTNIINDQDYANDIPRFPKVAYAIMTITEQTMENHYPIQCVLPINMVWEKLFIILSFWMMLVVVINIMKLGSVIINTESRRVAFVRDLIRIRSKGEMNDIQLISRFTEEFLKHDGVMIIRSLISNSGRTAVSHIVWTLWNLYLEREQNDGVLEISVHITN